MLLLEDRRFYVYIYLDPRKPGNFNYDVNGEIAHFDFEPFYVGKGKENRMYDHMHEALHININKKRVTFKIKKINKILKLNLYPLVFKIKEHLTEKEALNLEKSIICVMGRIDIHTGILTNLTDGGEGTSGSKRSQEQRMNYSNARKLQPPRSPESIEKGASKIRGRKQSKETIEKRMVKIRGVPKSEEHKKKTGDGNRGRVHGEETRRKNSEWHKGRTGKLCPNSKEVHQFTLEGLYIKTFDSVSDAQRLTGINNISACCNGIQKRAGNFKWSYCRK